MVRRLHFLLIPFLLGCKKPDPTLMEGIWYSEYVKSELIDTIGMASHSPDINKEGFTEYLIQTDTGNFYHFVSKNGLDSVKQAFLLDFVIIEFLTDSTAMYGMLRLDTLFEKVDSFKAWEGQPSGSIEINESKGNVTFPYTGEDMITVELINNSTLSVGGVEYHKYKNERKKN